MRITAASVQMAVITLFACRCSQTTASNKTLPWPNSVLLMQKVCPYQTVCNSPRRDSGIILSCCSGCSCEEDCSLKHQCCFEDENNQPTEEETCMFPRSKFPDTYIRSPADALNTAYYIVTKNPPSGCVNKSSIGCEAVDDSLLAPPVFSVARNKIYINSACAACHGVDEFIEWEMAVVCDGFGSSTPLDFTKELNNFLLYRSSPACFVYYHDMKSYPGLATRMCIKQGYEILLDQNEDEGDASVGAAFNMSMGTIFEACKSSFYAPVKTTNKWYPNPFCFIYDVKGDHSEVCSTRSDNPIGIEFFTLLDPSINAMLVSPETKPVARTPEACMDSVQNFQNFKKQLLCRPVSCPSGYVRDLEGRCIFIGKGIYYRSRIRLSAHLHLKRLDVSTTSETSFDKVPTREELEQALQISPKWSIALIGIPVNRTGMGTSTPDDILVRVQVANGQTNDALSLLYKQISKTIEIGNVSAKSTYTQHIYRLTFPLDFDLKLTTSYCAFEPHVDLTYMAGVACPINESKGEDSAENDRVMLTQSSRSRRHAHNETNDAINDKIKEYTKLGSNGNESLFRDDSTGNGTTKGTHTGAQEEVNTKNVIDAQHLTKCWDIIYADFRVHTDTFDLNKMYFCELIELMPDEFELLANESVLYYKARGTYLYAKEFMVLGNGKGDTIARICVEDSGFVLIQDNGANKGIGLTVSILAVTSVFVVLVVI